MMGLLYLFCNSKGSVNSAFFAIAKPKDSAGLAPRTSLGSLGFVLLLTTCCFSVIIKSVMGLEISKS